MTALYLDHRNLELSLHGQALHIRLDGALQRTIPLNLVDHIVCQASVTLSSSLLANLSEQGVGMTLFGGRYGQHSAHLGVQGTEDVHRRLGQYSLYTQPEQRLRWAIRLMAHKLLRQYRLLNQARQQRPDLRLELTRSLVPIQRLQQQLKQNPPDNIESLRGIEGSAGHLYFRAYTKLFPDSLGFVGRQRRPPPDPVNALLSLGYTLLHGEMRKAVESVGLDPWLGIYHEPAHGRASLICDLVEPYRPQIDQLIWQLIRTRTLREHHFSQEGPACLLNKEGRALFYPQYEDKATTLRPRLRKVALRIALAMAENYKPQE